MSRLERSHVLSSVALTFPLATIIQKPRSPRFRGETTGAKTGDTQLSPSHALQEEMESVQPRQSSEEPSPLPRTEGHFQEDSRRGRRSASCFRPPETLQSQQEVRTKSCWNESARQIPRRTSSGASKTSELEQPRTPEEPAALTLLHDGVESFFLLFISPTN